MNIYQRKKRWKWFLFITAVIIFALSLWYIDNITSQIKDEERNNIKIWVDAISKKASLVNATDTFFSLIQAEERRKVELWADANIRIIKAGYSEDLTFYLTIIQSNNTIPVILTNDENRITLAKNIDFNLDTVKYLEGSLYDEFSTYDPIEVNYLGTTNYLYYKDSKLFTGLKEVLDKQVKSFLSEIVTNAPSVPVIVTDSSRENVITFGNIDSLEIQDPEFIKRNISSMSAENNPIKIDLPGHGQCIVFYRDSLLLIKLKYFPYALFIIIGVFLFIAYLLFSTSRRSEQNQVWLGMSKETAHQLGTPLSSLIAWVELLRLRGMEEDMLTEVTKDIKRLETITERFSKIGSPPKLEPLNIVDVIHNAVDYIKKRTSKKVHYTILSSNNTIVVPLNSYLFEWVIENLCKNAIDAMSGSGSIEISIQDEGRNVFIDVSDTGKGIHKSKFKTIFNPGVSGKKTGWGLGLSLSERIIENYHSGRIFVKTSAVGKGSTFRIILRKNSDTPA